MACSCNKSKSTNTVNNVNSKSKDISSLQKKVAANMPLISVKGNNSLPQTKKISKR